MVLGRGMRPGEDTSPGGWWFPGAGMVQETAVVNRPGLAWQVAVCVEQRWCDVAESTQCRW
jgi:hypothetical protein